LADKSGDNGVGAIGVKISEHQSRQKQKNKEWRRQ